MTLKLYSIDASPPCRAVFLTAKALGVSLDIQEVNLQAQEHLQPKFIKINPQHTVPTLVDNDFIIWDSHAINAYLVGEYGKNDSLYPKDSKRRALVDQRLHFDTGSVFPSLAKIVVYLRSEKVNKVPDNLIEATYEVYSFLETFLNGNNWVAGENTTIADLSLIPSVTSLDVLAPIPSNRYPNITRWIKNAQELPYYNLNQKGLDDFKELFKKLES